MHNYAGFIPEVTGRWAYITTLALICMISNALSPHLSALARPADPNTYGYIAEHHGYGMTADQSGEYTEDLAGTMLVSTL